MQPIDLIETYGYRTTKDLVKEKEQVKCNYIIKRCKIPQIPNHPYRILIIGGSGSGKTNSSFNLKSHQTDIDKISL